MSNILKFSIFGFNGFVGTNIVDFLREQKIKCDEIDINDPQIFEKNLGHVIYCIGVTGDFKDRPFDTVESHVCLLQKILKKCKFESFLYLSSTRVYLNSTSTNETERLLVNPNNLDNLYNISKIMGESLCFSSHQQNVRVARLSNVIGNNKNQNDFISSIIHDALYNKKIILHTTSTSEKDYVSIDDVVKCLKNISLYGNKKIYNIASGKNTKVIKIINEIKQIINCEVIFADNLIEQSFPIINIQRIQEEFDFIPSSFFLKLKEIISINK